MKKFRNNRALCIYCGGTSLLDTTFSGRAYHRYLVVGWWQIHLCWWRLLVNRYTWRVRLYWPYQIKLWLGVK